MNIQTIAIRDTGWNRVIQNREESRQIRNGGNTDGQVTNPVGMIIKDAGLETECGRYFPGIRNWATLLWVLGCQSGINIKPETSHQ
ncbi:hypothetical protein DMH17_05930 [Raoultella planticola]|nr:hypothetical protein [Raoultella planticola]